MMGIDLKKVDTSLLKTRYRKRIYFWEKHPDSETWTWIWPSDPPTEWVSPRPINVVLRLNMFFKEKGFDWNLKLSSVPRGNDGYYCKLIEKPTLANVFAETTKMGTLNQNY